MLNEAGKCVDPGEQILMGMDMKVRCPAPFPEEIATKVEKVALNQIGMETSKEVGRTIRIPRK